MRPLHPVILVASCLAACAPTPGDNVASPVLQPARVTSRAEFNTLTLTGARFVGLRHRGGPVTPGDLQSERAADLRAALQLVVEDADGDRHHLTARVTASRRNAAGVQAHVVEYRGPRGDWRPLCRGGGEGVLIHGVTDEATGAHSWRDGAMTWACVDGALGRCASLGYFEDAPTPGALSALFQSCTRAVRADYCGDGIAHPRASNGTTIDVYDTLGVVAPAAGAGGLALEAEWHPDGAACLDAPAGATETLACAASLPTCAGREPRGVVTRVP